MEQTQSCQFDITRLTDVQARSCGALCESSSSDNNNADCMAALGESFSSFLSLSSPSNNITMPKLNDDIMLQTIASSCFKDGDYELYKSKKSQDQQEEQQTTGFGANDGGNGESSVPPPYPLRKACSVSTTSTTDVDSDTDSDSDSDGECECDLAPPRKASSSTPYRQDIQKLIHEQEQLIEQYQSCLAKQESDMDYLYSELSKTKRFIHDLKQERNDLIQQLHNRVVIVRKKKDRMLLASSPSSSLCGANNGNQYSTATKMSLSSWLQLLLKLAMLLGLIAYFVEEWISSSSTTASTTPLVQLLPLSSTNFLAIAVFGWWMTESFSS